MQEQVCANCGNEIVGKIVRLCDCDRLYCSEDCLDDDIEQPAAD